MSAIKHHLYQLETMTSRVYSNNVNEMYATALIHCAAKRLKRSLDEFPTELAAVVEEQLIPLLEYIDGWEPGDDDVREHVEARGVF